MKITGFSFAVGKIITVSDSISPLPDVIISVFTNETSIISAAISGLSGEKCLQRIYPQHAMFPNYIAIDTTIADTARKIFDSLIEAPETGYYEFSNVDKNQVWAIKTRENRYAKILILNSVARTDTSDSGSVSYYGQVTFDWVYQANGSRSFK
ncbi:MAG: hypothetical protein AB1349_14560 [Elusimicrobiota bacterium]